MPSLTSSIQSLVEKAGAWLIARRRLQLAPCDAHWCAGDLAQCMLDDPWRRPDGQIGTGPVLGEVRPVDRVVVRRHAHTGEMAAFLVFTRFGDAWFEAIAFRKYQPCARPVQLPLTQPFESEMS